MQRRGKKDYIYTFIVSNERNVAHAMCELYTVTQDVKQQATVILLKIFSPNAECSRNMCHREDHAFSPALCAVS